MKNSTWIVASAALASILALFGADSTPVNTPQAVVNAPAAVCAADCDCRCDCEDEVEASEPAAEPQASEPVAESPVSPRPVGELRVINGVQHKLVRSEMVDGLWRHTYHPVTNTSTPSSGSLATGYYDGSSRWSYPGDIASHLQGGVHRKSYSELAGLSKAQLEELHAADHDRMAGRSTRSSTPVYRQPVVRSSNCPGGVCPQPRRPFFGWR